MEYRFDQFSLSIRNLGLNDEYPNQSRKPYSEDKDNEKQGLTCSFLHYTYLMPNLDVTRFQVADGTAGGNAL